jgi:phosphoribosylformylglycinamidine synthase
MVGLLDDARHATGMTFHTPGDAIVLLGENTDELGGSEYLAWIHGVVAGAPPACDLDREKALIATVLEAIRAGHVHSAHDCSEGGLAVALAECCMATRDATLGARVELSEWKALPLRALLFGEAQGRIIVSTPDAEAVLAVARRHGVPARAIGTVTGASQGLDIIVGDTRLHAAIDRLTNAYHEALPRAMSRAAAEAVSGDGGSAGAGDHA